MTARRTTPKGPVAGASRVYRLVPADAEDAFAWAAEWFRARGWVPVEQDYEIHATYGAWIDVHLWAIPPSKQPASAAGGGS